jgi:hypothetical protein
MMRINRQQVENSKYEVVKMNRRLDLQRDQDIRAAIRWLPPIN